MKNRAKLIWRVTKWEFNRFFKWRDMLKGALYMMLFSLTGGGIGVWLASESTEIPIIAVSDFGVYNPETFERKEINFQNRHGEPIEKLSRELEAGTLDAILTVVTADSAVIHMQNERAWLLNLRQFLKEERTAYKLRHYNIHQNDYAHIGQGMTLQTQFKRDSETSFADKAVAGVSIFLVLMAVFLSFAYQFSAITAEKQRRITEQVISAIPPQVWMDGKILGITGIGLIHMMYYGLLGLAGMITLIEFTGAPLGESLKLLNPTLVMLFLLLSLLGILMWNAFFAAVAATINDPNSSVRTSLMFLPLIPVTFSFFTLANPDSFAIQILGIFPLTSYSVLPARMVLSQVFWWEPFLAIILLAATVWLFRGAAGKVFATAMMMYGKEPGIREMIHWFRKSDAY